MQITNKTERRIVLEPGEGINATVDTVAFDGETFRHEIRAISDGPSPVEELPGIRDLYLKKP